MRIIEVVTSLSEHSSGLTHAVTRISEQLRQRGNDLTLAYAARTPLRSASAWIRAFPRGRLLGRLGSSPAMRRWLVHAAAAEPRPIIHSHSMWLMPVMYASWAAQRCRVPYVVSPHSALAAWAMTQGSRMKPLMWACMQRRALEAATCFHATAASEAAEIRALGFRQPIAVIPHGIDMPAGPPARAPRRAEVLFLGRLSQKKGIDTLLRAWHGVAGRYPKWQLRIVGPDDRGHGAKMRALASAIGVERVTFAGALVGDARTEAYERASLFVLPSHNESFGLAVGEALAHATPVIVSKGVPWQGVERHGCGWWIDLGVDALAAALVQAMSCPAGTLAEMGERGRRWVHADFSWDQAGRQTEELYRWLLLGGAAAERPAFVALHEG